MVPAEPVRFRIGFTMPRMPGFVRQINELENARTSIDRAAMIDERLESLAQSGGSNHGVTLDASRLDG